MESVSSLKFQKICKINLFKANDEEILKYGKGRSLHGAIDAINTSDNGPFCRFKIPPLGHWKQEWLSGVYIIYRDAEAVYVGQTANLVSRFNTNYGYISQWRDVGHAAEVNKKILESAEGGHLLELYFLRVSEKSERLETEKYMIQKLNPIWNKMYADSYTQPTRETKPQHSQSI